MAHSGKGGNVSRGSIWDTKTPVYSKETQELLKVMMKESKLTSFQQRQLSSAMRDGSSLPVSCNPTTSKKPSKPSSPAKPKVKVLELRSGLKTREEIEATGAYDRPQFVPMMTKSMEKEKQRLANYMAYGKDFPEPTLEQRQQMLREPTPEPEPDRFDQLEEEIRERAEFLDEMRALGRAQEYEPIIQTQISQKIREMEVIDKQRTAALRKALDSGGKKDANT